MVIRHWSTERPSKGSVSINRGRIGVTLSGRRAVATSWNITATCGALRRVFSVQPEPIQRFCFWRSCCWASPSRAP
jgi:hypothetical protein